ncbi:N-Acetylneuraminate cytidylyltransferase [Labilithrix luteola]|uniref:N-Acetylneuraminate cytidylyltransferase n=1 Tax=Labilithrix luteola TaxID=1391654 RepID=A0A0K1Q648_9BACT|nr:N-Acetylneuraminate cytidylyltransferase [Labilithrix luteola]
MCRSLSAKGAVVEFAISEPSAHVRSWIERAGYCVHSLADDGGTLRRVVRETDLVIADGYGFGPETHEALAGGGRVFCVIDDLGVPVRADVVVNGNLFAERLTYAGVPKTLLGPTYALVRDEFLQVRNESAVVRGERPRLLVTMGGSDPAGATEVVLRSLDEIDDADVRTIVGAANLRAAEIRELARRIERHHVEVVVDAQRMSEEMRWCDVAISAAGSTCLELSCVGVPAIVFAIADNQEPVAEEAARRGLMLSVGRFDAGLSARLVEALRGLMSDHAARGMMVERQRATVDGAGSERAAHALVEEVRRRGRSE